MPKLGLPSQTMSKRYRKIDFLGEGQFATVFKAEDTENENRIVAVKKIKIGQKSDARDGINRTALREIKFLGTTAPKYHRASGCIWSQVQYQSYI